MGLNAHVHVVFSACAQTSTYGASEWLEIGKGRCYAASAEDLRISQRLRAFFLRSCKAEEKGIEVRIEKSNIMANGHSFKIAFLGPSNWMNLEVYLE